MPDASARPPWRLLAGSVRGTMRADTSFRIDMRDVSLGRSTLAMAVLLALCCADARAMSIDAKAMARFDLSYAKCEAKYPQMRGARDEAYLSMWRVKLDDKSRAELATVRKSATYRAESRRAQAEAAKKTEQASSPLEQQCQALWSETLRVRNLAN
jgi:hypothetical protein